MKITRVIAHLMDEACEPFTWQRNRPGSGDGRAIDRRYGCWIRIQTDEGIEGYAKGGKGRIDMDLVERRFGPELVGKDPMQTEFLWERMWDIDRLEEFPLYSFGLADVALWDIKGKVANLPVYKMLGGYRDSLPAYASTKGYVTEGEYYDVISASLEEGYPAIKLHLYERDVYSNADLCRKIRRFVGDHVIMLMDASAMWNYTDSLWFGRVMEELDFRWYEEPMREFDLGSYAKLCDDLDIPVLAAETSDGAHWNAAEFIRRGACDIMRTSVHYKGGFTGAVKVAHLAESFGMNAEVHGGGLTNLQLGLAIPNNAWYEDGITLRSDVKEKVNGPIPFKDGWVSLPEGIVGVGWDVDMGAVERHALQTVCYPE